MRGSAAKAGLCQRGRVPWRGTNPGELRALVGLTHRRGWRTLVRSKALKAGWLLGCPRYSGLRCWAGASVPVWRRDSVVGFSGGLPNDKRAQASETAYGCARGGKL
jgi:hypothetical protein